MKRKLVYRTMCGLISCILVSLVLANEAKADGDDMLGPPANIDIASGSYIMVEGTGLRVQPGNISIDIPGDALISQVLLYWSGRSQNEILGDLDTVQVNGNPVEGLLIGVSTEGAPYPSHTYRADITEENWLSAGGTSDLIVSGLDFYLNDGAAVVVILNDGSPSDIQIMDGDDFAWKPEGTETVPITFPIIPSIYDREGYIWTIVTDVAYPRPAAVDITVGGITTRYDLSSNRGDSLDVVEVMVSVPALASNVIVQAVSINDEFGRTPASLAWHFVSWELAIPHTECGGGGLTPGFWQNKHGLGLIDEYGALYDLNELCLRDDDGEHADFDTLGEFRAWIKARRAKNMAFQLSGHLAAMYMNELVGSVNEDALVYYIGHEGDMISIKNLLNAANTALCEDAENRDYLEILKNALDKANNNLNWVYPCTSHN